MYLLIESFDIIAFSFENKNEWISFFGTTGDSFYEQILQLSGIGAFMVWFINFIEAILGLFFFTKVKFLLGFIIFYAIIIFYMNYKSIKNNLLFITFLNGFNQNLKGALFFKKINFLK